MKLLKDHIVGTMKVAMLATVLSVILPTQALARAPNVVIFLTDDQGTLDAHCYGASDLETPSIDRLATTGVRFTQAYAHMVCCPTRAALLTGRHPQRGNVNTWTQGNLRAKSGNNMSLDELTLAEVLRASGYRTGLFGKWHLGAGADFGPTRQGFDEFFEHRGGFIDNFNHHFLHQKGFHDLYEGTQEVFATRQFFPDLLVKRALEFIEQNRERPFFLYVPFNSPHYPEQPPAEFLAKYENLDEPRRTYAAFVTMTDHMIGEILDKLESLRLRDNTIVVFMSDNGHSTERNEISVDDHRSGLPKGHRYGANGGGGYTGKWRGHKATFFEGGIRVPAILSFPLSVPQGAVRDQAVTAMDWFPTILDYCDIDLPDSKLDGYCLRAICESARVPSPHPVIHFQWINSWAVREGEWKLICLQGRGIQSKPRYALYNLNDESPESIDHSAEQPDVVRRLMSRHAVWAQDVFAGEQ